MGKWPKQNRQIRRLEKCIDELIKIQDDGKGNETIARLLDTIGSEIIDRENDI